MLPGIIADTRLPKGGRWLPARCVESLSASDLILHAGDVSALEPSNQLVKLD